MAYLFIIRPDRSSSARCGLLLHSYSVVCVCGSVFLLDTTVSPTKTAEQLEVLFAYGLGWAQGIIY